MNSQLLILGTRKGLLIFNGSNEFKLINESFVGIRVSLTEIDPRDGTLYAMLDHGHYGCKLHRWNQFLSDDPTRTDRWEELPQPAYPEGCKLKNGNDAVLNYQWAMAFGSAEQPGRVYLGTEPGGMFVSDDRGDHFELCKSLWDHPSRLSDTPGWMGGGLDEPAIHSICVDPDDHDTIRVGISVAGVFETRDGMQTWAPSNNGLRAEFLPDPEPEVGHDPHLMVQCSGEPDKLWQQNHCGVFRSCDRGATWTGADQESGPVDFGFTIVVDDQNGDRAWVVPAVSDQNRVAIDRKLVVCRTEDGGRSWTEFRNGLPQEDCYDFALRHCLYRTGRQMVMGTTSGNLYVSNDDGENWQLIRSSLPLIYSARNYLV